MKYLSGICLLFGCVSVGHGASLNYSKETMIEILATERCIQTVDFASSEEAREARLAKTLQEKGITFNRQKLKQDQEEYKKDEYQAQLPMMGVEVLQKSQRCVADARSASQGGVSNYKPHYSDDEFSIIGAQMICAMGKVGNDDAKIEAYLTTELPKKGITFVLTKFQADEKYRRAYTDYYQTNAMKVMTLAGDCGR